MEKCHTRLLQLHSVDHCNYTCLECSAAAPAAKKCFYSYEDYRPHLEKLSEYVDSYVVTISGGEAFLNKNLLQLAQGVRSSGILEKKGSILQVDSNGFWFRDWEKYVEILDFIDLLRFTIHPEQNIPKQEIDDIVNKIRNHCRVIGGGKPRVFCKVIFFDDPIPRKDCKFCLQVLADGHVAKCNIIPYPHEVTKSFDDLKHEGLYDIHSGDAKSFEKWHTRLHPCCDFCGFDDRIKYAKHKVPHRAAGRP